MGRNTPPTAADADARLAAAAATTTRATRETALEEETTNLRARLDVAENARAKKNRGARGDERARRRDIVGENFGARGDGSFRFSRQSAPSRDVGGGRAAIEALAEHQRAMWAQLDALRVERERVGGWP